MRILAFLNKFNPFPSLRKKYRKELSAKPWGETTPNLPSYFQRKLDKYEFRSITCHSCQDVLWVNKYLKDRGLKSKIIQMSHSPTLPSIELRDFYLPIDASRAQFLFNKWAQFERLAFETADIILAPARESLKPYEEEAPYFTELLQRKPLKLLPTGCAPLIPTDSRENLRKKFGITTPYVICYVGRHQAVRGYDRLKIIGQTLLSKRDDITFLIGGALGNELSPLQNPRWIELGWTNPADVFCASDLFISPGRQVYFDLILLEALSMGKCILASGVYGNQAVFNQSHALELFQDEQDCINKVLQFLSLSNEEKNALQKKAKAAYDTYYTLEHFAKNYKELIQNIIEGK